MSIYRTDIWIAATVYVRASNAEEAAKIANGIDFDGIELQEQELFGDDLSISGARFDSEDMPDLSLSPVMTIYTRHLDGIMNARPLLSADDMEEAE